MLEGNHHADVALSLALGSQLQRIRSTNAFHVSNQVLAPPADPIEETERIDAFWTVLVLNNNWSAIQASQSTYSTLQNSAVDTPWPIDSVHQEYIMLPVASRTTLQDFLDGRSGNAISEKALHAKSSVLFERASSIHNGDKRSILQSGAFTHLDSLIDSLQSILPSLGGTSSDRHIVTQMLLYAAMIKLHRPFFHEIERSYHKSLFAAQAIARLTRSSAVNTNQLHINPIIGVIWTLACETLMPLVISQTGNNELATSLDLLLSYMKRFSELNPLFMVARTDLRKQI
ncbi:hypothetical protein C0991_004419 [Blastosporella zonata]|nr:hypothetical protein C0991_004419 [Blastosporella zonata]